MDLTPYVEKLRRELAVAAEAGGPEARAMAERLTGPLESATRLALLEALSAAAGEITRELAPGSVDVLLRGGDPAFVVTPAPAPSADAAPEPTFGGAQSAAPAPVSLPDSDEGGTARLTLRLPDQLKARVEQAANRQGASVNAWLVRAVSASLEPEAAARPRSGRDYTGWVR